MSEEEDNLKFTQACTLRDAKRYGEAVELYEALINAPATARRLVVHSHIQAGVILKGLFLYEAAEVHARRVVALAPNNQLASLLLFHVLMSRAEALQALKEMVRFVKRKDSPMYRDLIVAGTYDPSSLGEEYRLLVAQARSALDGWEHRQ